MQTIGDRIKEKRKEKGLTQLDLATRLNITDRAVSKWEQNEGNPDFSLLANLAEILDVSLDYLITGKVENSIFLEDMDKEKRLHYLVKKDDLINFIKYGYDQMSGSNTLFTQLISFSQFNFKMINLGLWKELLREDANNIISYAFDIFLNDMVFGKMIHLT